MCRMEAVVAASERVLVLMSPDEKQALDAKAARAGRISTGELVRRAVTAYDEGGTAAEEAELRGLPRLFTEVHGETLRRLEASERKLDETLDYLQRGRHPE